MIVPKTLQGYVSGSQIFGEHGDPWEVRAGASWYFMKDRGLRLNGEWIYVRKSPVGYTAYPMPVGANGPLFHINLRDELLRPTCGTIGPPRQASRR